MKNQFLVICMAFFALVFTSCKKEKETVNPVDPIVGSWTVESKSILGQTTLADDCEKKTNIIMNEDKTIGGTSYSLNDAETECVGESGAGSWINNGNNKYTIALDADKGDALLSGNKLTITIPTPLGAATLILVKK